MTDRLDRSFRPQFTGPDHRSYYQRAVGPGESHSWLRCVFLEKTFIPKPAIFKDLEGYYTENTVNFQ